MRARVKSDRQPESPATDVNGIEPRLSGDHVDRLLTDTATDISTSDGDEATPMNGVWLAAAAGVILWALIAAVVLVLT